MKSSCVLLVVNVFCLALSFAKHGRDTGVCTPPPSGTWDAGPKVKLPDQFSVHIELIEIDQGLTTTLNEYFDKVNNRGLIVQKREGIELKAYYDYRTNELLQVYPQEKNKCIVDQLNRDENNFLMGTTLRNGTVRMFSAAQALHFQDRGIYKGTETIRGINTIHWQSCQYWPAVDTTVDAHWYFTANEAWDTATGLAYVPVRFQVKGSAYDSDTEKYDINRVYEFYHFRSGLPKDQTILETPTATYCPGRKTLKPLPQIPETMSFYTEIVDKNDVIVTTIKEEYDRLAKLARFSYTALPMYNLYNNNPVIDIHDFETGVSYVTNTVLGNCTARPIPHKGLDVQDVNAHNVRMSTAASFFDFPNKNYSYEGSKTIRGTDAESWVGIRSGWPRKTSKQSVWEWYFAQGSTIDVTGKSQEHAAPLQLRVSLPEEQMDYDFNIYAYTKEQPDLSGYDVSACYLFHKREKIGMTLPLMYEFFINSNVKMFKFFIITAIATTTGISPLRIQNIDINMGYKMIFITFELVDVAPIVGDVAKPMKEVSLDTAVKTILDKLNTNTFQIEVFNGAQVTILKPTPFNLDIVKYKNASQVTSYTGGSMIGLGIAMSLLGILSGGLISYFKCQ